MYESIIDSITESANTIISHYEGVFNINYGTIPQIDIVTVDDVTDYVCRHYTSMNVTPPDFVIKREAINTYNSIFGLYDCTTHSILIPDHVAKGREQSDNGLFEYVLTHELAHGFQFNNGARGIGSMLREQIDTLGEEEFFHDEYTNLLARCNIFGELSLLEGMADYMAYHMLEKCHEQDKTSSLAFKYGKIDNFKYKDMKEKYTSIVNAMIELRSHLEANHLTIDDQYLIIPNISKLKYKAGYGYVENLLEQDVSFTDMLANPPKTLEDMLLKKVV